MRARGRREQTCTPALAPYLYAFGYYVKFGAFVDACSHWHSLRTLIMPLQLLNFLIF